MARYRLTQSFPVATLPGLLVATAIVVASLNQALADYRERRLHGIFCNTEAQLDEVVLHMQRNLAARSAVELANRDEVVCNYVDLVQYVVDGLSFLGTAPGATHLVKYQARLTAVVVGGVVRPVTPPVQIFFVAPRRLDAASIELRI